MKQPPEGTSMLLKSLITTVALGVGLVGTGLATAEATTAPKSTPSNPPKAAPGKLPKAGAGNLPTAAPGKLPPLHKNPNYTG
jgi:hypothetical protein